MRRHEVDRGRRRHLRGDDEVALILAVLVVDEDVHAPVACFVDDLLRRRHRRGVGAVGQPLLELAQRFGGRVPAGGVQVAQAVGVQTGGAGEAGLGDAALLDEDPDTIDDAHDWRHITS